MPYTTGLGGRFVGLSFPITTNYTGAVFVFFVVYGELSGGKHTDTGMYFGCSRVDVDKA